MEDRILCFAISGDCEENQTLYGIPVKNIASLTEEYGSILFLIAVAECSYGEVAGILKRKRARHFIDAKKIYLASYQLNDIELRLRKVRDKKYLRTQEGKKQSHPRVTHITYWRAQNAGDTMLSYCVRQFLPFQSWKIRTVSESINDDVIKQINETDMLLIGGGLILPDTNSNSISGWQWAISEEQLEHIQVPIIVFSVGYNYFKEQENSKLFTRSVNTLVKKASFVGLRNMGSVRAIQDILDPSLRDKVVYQPCTTTLIDKILPVKKWENTKNVGVNIAFDREEQRFGQNREKILKEIANAVYKINQLGYKICYIAHCDEDLRFLKYLERLDMNFTVYNLTCALPREILSCYQRMEIVLGMRGHAPDAELSRWEHMIK